MVTPWPLILREPSGHFAANAGWTTRCRPLFVGIRGERLTRFGATHVVRRAVKNGVERAPELARKKVSPYLLRHTLAMGLLQSGVDLMTIQAWLGHAQVATTHRYAEADVEMMRRSLLQYDHHPQRLGELDVAQIDAIVTKAGQ